VSGAWSSSRARFSRPWLPQDERTRIARDLHDTLLQSFQRLLLRFQSASNVLPARRFR